MSTILLFYGSVIVVSFITGIFVTIYNNKHNQRNVQTNTLSPAKNIDKTIINEPPIIEPNPEIDENKTYYDLPVIVSVVNSEE